MIKPDILEKPVKVVYLGIGSNIGNRCINIEKAKFLLLENNISLISTSSYYETPSWPNPKNPKFINIIIEANTNIPADELIKIYQDGAGLKPGEDVIAYCRIGERSSHTWFVLTYLLGYKNVKNYDG